MTTTGTYAHTIPRSERESFVQPVWKYEKLREFACRSLEQSLTDIGFTTGFTDKLLGTLDNWNFESFYNSFDADLERVYRLGFFQNIVPRYFEQQVLPLMPSSNNVLDIGCGTGILAKKLGDLTQIGQITGIDLKQYPEWAQFASDKVKFQVVDQQRFPSFLTKNQFDNVFITWTLHHMPYAEQKSYLQQLRDRLSNGSRLVVLEDGYATTVPPQSGERKYQEFMALDASERHKVMSLFDWIANRVLAKRTTVPIPCTYRTLEEWKALFTETGFSVKDDRFIGFPDDRDINTPQIVFTATISK